MSDEDLSKKITNLIEIDRELAVAGKPRKSLAIAYTYIDIIEEHLGSPEPEVHYRAETLEYGNWFRWSMKFSTPEEAHEEFSHVDPERIKIVKITTYRSREEYL